MIDLLLAKVEMEMIEVTLAASHKLTIIVAR